MTTFDEDTRLKLIGMRAVVADLWKQIEAFQDAAKRLVGEDEAEYSGHSSDFLFGDTTLDEFAARVAASKEKANA